MDEQLLPCPFCGGEAQVLDYDTEIDGWPIVCLGKDCMGRVLNYDSRAAAIANWNRRQPKEDSFAAFDRSCGETLESLCDYLMETNRAGDVLWIDAQVIRTMLIEARKAVQP
jgi:Lar family restriction alleviation protein